MSKELRFYPKSKTEYYFFSTAYDLNRLKDKGVVFSDIPTEAEIETTKKSYELKKDLEGIDPNAIIESGVKRKAAKEDSGNHKKKATDEDGKPLHRTESGQKRHNLDLDEEADF
jgi:hypothetical protein